MAGRYAIAIVGSGPGGLSAAGRAAELGTPHILLESAGWASDTIYKYQKGKHVMATPDVLPLRSPFSFAAGTREQVLGAWDGALESLNVNIRHNAEVTAIKGEKGNFELTLRTGDVIAAEHVVLAIGLQGNLRKLEVPGADQPFFQYQLDDPEEYEDEYIIVIGAGDAAIENALALAKQNSVTIVNRRDEFARAKDGNLSLMTEAIDKGVIECMYNSAPKEIGADFMVLSTAEGEATIACNRVIARLGAIPPRRFVESCGVEFPSDDIMALPQLSSHYESNIPGLYLIGALGGYPLIKQAMNQGYEVVEFILGNDVKPADEPLLEAKFDALGDIAVDEVLERIRSHVPILSGLTTLQLREFMIDSDVHTPGAGDVVFQRNEYTNSSFTIVDGLVAVQVNPEDPDDAIRLGTGEFFGEMGLISGRRRTATVVAEADCFLIETPRRSMIKLINSVEAVKRVMDQTAMARQIQTNLAPEIPTQEFSEVLETATIQTFASGQTLFVEGDEGESIYLIRRGSVTVARRIGDRDVVLSYVPAGHYVGEMALLSKAPRSATVRAAVATETVVLEAAAFRNLLERKPALRERLESKLQERLIDNVRMEGQPDSGNVIEFLVNQGVGEATDILLIDESLCVRCDNCEKACAETHGGTSRLDREAGPTFAAIHVPTSCRHCEHPHCMSDCPADAIHRAPNGEVFIDEKCIGCGNCQRNCPYDVIHMASPPPRQAGPDAMVAVRPRSRPG